MKNSATMKKYLILAFKTYGVFNCIEQVQDTKEIFLIGRFNNKGALFTFVKHPKDLQLTNQKLSATKH